MASSTTTTTTTTTTNSSYPPNHPSHYPPSSTALLLLDFHKMILSQVPSSSSSSQPQQQPEGEEEEKDSSPLSLLLNSTKRLLTAARTSSGDSSPAVLHCLVDIHGVPLPSSKIYERWTQNYAPMMLSTPDAGGEHEEFLLSGEGEREREKTFIRRPGVISALRSSEEGKEKEIGILEYLKKEEGIKSLVLCGVATGGCVLSTAREAADEGFVVSVVRESCWDPNREAHEALLGIGNGGDGEGKEKKEKKRNRGTLEMSGWVLGVEEAEKVLRGEGLDVVGEGEG